MLFETSVDGNWSEGFRASNIMVRNNTIEAANSKGAVGGTAIAIAAHVDGHVSDYPLQQNLLFENNTFREMTGPALVAASFENLIIRNNIFTNLKDPLRVLPQRDWIEAQLGNGLWIEGNQWTHSAGFPPACLTYDPKTVHGLTCNKKSSIDLRCFHREERIVRKQARPSSGRTN